MTLTEEQRAALKRVIAYMNRMYGIASPYYGCTEDANILRAMIDSSGTVEPTGGFDLEAARAALVGALKPGGYHDQETARIIHMHMPSLLAEIERLRATIEGYEIDIASFLSDRQVSSEIIRELRAKKDENALIEAIEEQAARIKELRAELASANVELMAAGETVRAKEARIQELKKEIRRLKHESKVEQEFTNSYIKRLHDAEARIKELESSLDEAEALTKKNAELMNGYLGRIAELEDALVEGLTNFLHYRASCYDPARRCPYAKECDDCSTWDACGHVEKFRSEARRRLQAEGKIGPDATKPQSWQITEERIGLLEYCLETLLDAPDIEEIPGPGHSIEMLRAMLREAEQ